MSALVAAESTSTAALRAELEEELRNKKQCTYQSYECTQLCLDGYKFCSKHILQDKNAPFKQCSYVFSSNGKRCHLPAPRAEKKDFGYCHEHALKATLARNKQNSKSQPPKTAEVLLHSLSHYVKKPKVHIASTSYSEDDHSITEDNTQQKTTKYNDPFVDLDACSIYNDCCNEVLEFCSESESDVEPSTLSSVWHDGHADSSNDESIDSEQEDPLKHANVYSAEEVTIIIRDKLIKLQSLYIEQYRHLQYLLKEKRRKYLHALKREKETCCNIYNQVRDNPKEQRLYKKLKALNNYQKCHGVEAILSKRLRDLRAKTSEVTGLKAHSSVKCIFTEGGVKCGERTLPLTKYCKKHILEDPNQILYRACGKVNGDIECNTPIAAIFDDSTCILHMDIPLLKSYNQVRKDSESDMDDPSESGNTNNYSGDNFPESINHDFVPYDIPSELPKMETLPSLLFEENSQSLSESTVSQNEIFNVTDSNLNSNPNMSFDNKEKIESDLDLYRISESLNLGPGTSGYNTTNSSQVEKFNEVDTKSDENDVPSTSKTSKLGSIPSTGTSFIDQLINSKPIAGTSRMTDPENQHCLNGTQQTSQNKEINFNSDIQDKSHQKSSNDLNKPQVSSKESAMDVVDMEIETTVVSNEEKYESEDVERKTSEQLEGQHLHGDTCEMELCTEEVLPTNDVVQLNEECNKESPAVKSAIN